MESERKLTSPDFIYSQSRDKQRVVITGNHATIIAGMIIHVLHACKREFDYLTSRTFPGNNSLSKMSNAPVIVIEDSQRPFSAAMHYHHHIGVITDFDDTDEVIRTLIGFADGTPKAGILIFSEEDPAGAVGKKQRADITAIPYGTNPHTTENGKLVLISNSNERFPMAVSGEQNARCISGAREVLIKLGITSDQFYRTIASFEG
jgi:UDP-N-acetylmuramate: L-alanyl-gamma-D-glutamyl-meso-diaminopimelate ligase